MTPEERQKKIDRLVAERVKAELDSLDTEESYRDMLDECYSFKAVGGIFAAMSPANVLEEVDPVAYRCGLNDYEDSLTDSYTEIDEEYYSTDEVDAIREEVEAEMDEAEEAD